MTSPITTPQQKSPEKSHEIRSTFLLCPPYNCSPHTGTNRSQFIGSNGSYHMGFSDRYSDISPKEIIPFTHADWNPRVLVVSHVGDRDRDAITINIVAKGVITNPITVQLTQKALQAEISGSEQVADSLRTFMAEGLVQSVGRFLPTQNLVTPFAVSCDVASVADSRIRFNKEDMAIVQSFDTARCPSLTATAILTKLE